MKNKFKIEAEKRGYTFFYDRKIRLWTLVKEGEDTDYIPPFILRQADHSLLIKSYLKPTGGIK